jgi:hypothetical protein
MGTFTENLNSISYTENGALTYNTTKSACLDLFSMGGSMRSRSNDEITDLFMKAYAENPEYAIRTLLYLRDIRLSGMGEKKVYRVVIRKLLDKGLINFDSFIDITIEYGSWKDIFEICTDNEISYAVKRELAFRIEKKILHPSLMEKYAFSIGGKDNKRAENLAYSLGLTPKKYRKWLSKSRAELEIVEQKMCSNSWDKINYEHVPSKAMLTYQNAFKKHSEKFGEYLEAVKTGEKKINASVLYPYEIVRKIITPTIEDNTKALDVLWNNLKNYRCDGNSIVVCDTSGSMYSNNRLPISVAVSLAIYFAERNVGKFKGEMITFSEKPTFFEIDEDNDIDGKVTQVSKADWGGNTNLQKVFSLLLNTCVKNHVPESEMPKNIYIVSDMEFDEATSSNKSMTNFDAIKEQYANAGYEMPKLIFWNVDSRQNNVPIQINENGVALVSGCSPSIFEQTITADLNPMKFMIDAIMKPVYDCAVELLKR